jgi:hypothetical protein
LASSCERSGGWHKFRNATSRGCRESATAFGLEPKQLYTMLGFMDEEASTAPPSVEQAIQLDTQLDAAQKEALIRIYRSLVSKG